MIKTFFYMILDDMVYLETEIYNECNFIIILCGNLNARTEGYKAFKLQTNFTHAQSPFKMY